MKRTIMGYAAYLVGLLLFGTGFEPEAIRNIFLISLGLCFSIGGLIFAWSDDET